jgi:hypothetical protein
MLRQVFSKYTICLLLTGSYDLYISLYAYTQ